MSIKSKYQCDVCKSVFEAERELVKLSLTLLPVGVAYGRTIHNMHICPECITRLDIKIPEKLAHSTNDQVINVLADFVQGIIEDQ